LQVILQAKRHQWGCHTRGGRCVACKHCRGLGNKVQKEEEEEEEARLYEKGWVTHPCNTILSNVHRVTSAPQLLPLQAVEV